MQRAQNRKGRRLTSAIAERRRCGTKQRLHELPICGKRWWGIVRVAGLSTNRLSSSLIQLLSQAERER